MLNYQKKPIGEDFTAIFEALLHPLLGPGAVHKPSTCMRSVREKKRVTKYFSMNLLRLLLALRYGNIVWKDKKST